MQFWNLNDGSPLIQVEPQLYSTTLAHIYASLPKSVSTLSYETLASGSSNRVRKLMLIGTEQGNLCGFQESNSIIEECPVFFLRLTDFAPMEHVVKTVVATEVRKGRLNTLVSGLVQNKRAAGVQFSVDEEIDEQTTHPGQNKGRHALHGLGAEHPHSDAHTAVHVQGFTDSHHGASHAQNQTIQEPVSVDNASHKQNVMGNDKSFYLLPFINRLTPISFLFVFFMLSAQRDCRATSSLG